jgi:ubiquinone/menaquinone biosynthesis C-methylase UbiE
MYVCPVCKEELDGLQCFRCAIVFELNDDIPVFFTESTISNRYKKIGSFYDNLYKTRKNVWKKETGRGPEFDRYMTSLVESYGPERYLDVGCGEGILLNYVSVPEKHGIEISQKALRSASARATAKLCQGCVEELPYPSNYFNIVTGIGVIRHLLDPVSATKEIHRVLAMGGLYILLLYMKTPISERIMTKVSEFLYPSFRPASLILWVQGKCSKWVNKQDFSNHSEHSVVQPVNVEYTNRSLKKLSKSTGFEIIRLITKREFPDAPLKGHHFRIYILKKRRT